MYIHTVKVNKGSLPYMEAVINELDKHIDLLSAQIKSKSDISAQEEIIRNVVDDIRQQLSNVPKGITLTAMRDKFDRVLEKYRCTINELSDISTDSSVKDTECKGVAPELQLKLISLEDELVKQERLKDLQALEADMASLHDLFTDFNILVVNQQPHIDSIESAVYRANDNVEDGVSDIIRAYHYEQRKKCTIYKWACCIFFLLIILGIGIYANYAH